MATHDYVIDNQTAPNFRADLNNALLAIVSNNSNATAPAVTYANMMWYDTAANILYMRNEDNDAWIRLGTLDQTADTFAAAVALASQAEAEAGTNNAKVMTPLRVAQAIVALAAAGDVDDLFSGSVGGTSTLFSALGTNALFSVSGTLAVDVPGGRFRAITSGTVRVSFEMRNINSQIDVRTFVLKNGASVFTATRTQAQTSFATFTVDVAFIPDDVILVRLQGGATSGQDANPRQSELRNLRFQTSSNRLLGGI